MTDELLYEIAISQQEQNRQSFEALRNRSGQIISFIGVILNLEILSSAQIVTKNPVTPHLLLLVCSSIILFVAIIIAFISFIGTKAPTIDADKLIDKYHDEEDRKQVLRSVYATIAKTTKAREQVLHKKNQILNYSIFLLLIGLFFVLLFFYIYIKTLLNI